MTTFTGKIPLLNGDNFVTWKTQMEAILHKNRLLGYVNGKLEVPREATKLEEYKEKDQDARCELIIAMEPAQVALVKNYETSNQIWKFLENTYERKSTRKKVEEFRKLTSFKMNSHDSMEKQLIEFNSIISRLQECEAKLDDYLLSIILLDSLPPTYKEIQAAFDAATDFPTLDVLRSRLLEIGDKQKNHHNLDNAMKANYKHHKNTGKSIFPFKCHRCGRVGHMKRDCRVKIEKEKNVLANDIKGFIACENFENVFHDKTMNVNERGTIWYIDSGATSHMCSNENAFIEINKDYKGKVQLADDKAIDIVGIGTVELNVDVGKGVSTVRLYKTLLVPQLKSNLISASKATDNGCSYY